YACPVCGYPMEDPPSDFNICPSCGTEFGLHDAICSVEELRANWIRTGPKWWSTVDAEPKDWKPWEQVAKMLVEAERQRRLSASLTYFRTSVNLGTEAETQTHP